MPVDNDGNEIAENELPVEPVVENEPAPVEFTPEQQAQIDSILSERITEVRNQSAAELQALRQQAEAEINGYRNAFEQARQGVRPANGGIEDDPEPEGMTVNQKTMWDADYHNRIARKKHAAELQDQISAALKPLQADSVAKDFFAEVSARAGGKTIPPAMKQKALELYNQALKNPEMRRADPKAVMEAAWVRGLAAYQEQLLFGGGVAPGVTGALPAKPGARIATPPSADVGGGSSARIPGAGRIGGKTTTWQEDLKYLAENNLFPEDRLK